MLLFLWILILWAVDKKEKEKNLVLREYDKRMFIFYIFIVLNDIILSIKLMLCCVHFVYREDLNQKRKTYYDFLETLERDKKTEYKMRQITNDFHDIRVQIDDHDDYDDEDYLHTSTERKLDEASLNLAFKV
jgi:hypothetical protein